MRSARRRQRASELMREIGKEVLLARSTLGLSRNATARLAGIASSTLASIEAGKGSVQFDTVASVCEGIGLRLWAKAYPAKPPSLRDTGQLELVTSVTKQAHSAWRPAMELVVDPKSGRAADLVLFGPDEIQHQEFERNLLDWQAQYRSGRVKQELLTGMHQRPVRFVLAIEDTHRNREILKPHMASIRAELPASSRGSGGRYAVVGRSDATGSSGFDGLVVTHRTPPVARSPEFRQKLSPRVVWAI